MFRAESSMNKLNNLNNMINKKIPQRVEFLLSPMSIRKQAGLIFELCKQGKTHFDLRLQEMEKFRATLSMRKRMNRLSARQFLL